MKKLDLFRNFDWKAFSEGKTFACTGVKFSERKQMVTADVVIITDKTDYGDETVSNLFEKFKVSIPGTVETDVSRYAAVVNQPCAITNIQRVSVEPKGTVLFGDIATGDGSWNQKGRC